jgi:hypothetical protein
MGGATAFDSRSARRWLLILLAFALVAASLFFAAPPAAAAQTPAEIALDERFIEWVTEDDVVHLFADYIPAAPGDDTEFTLPEGSTVLFGFEVLDGPTDNITLSIDGGAPFSVNSGYQDPIEADPGVGPAWQWDHDGDGATTGVTCPGNPIGDGNCNGVGDWDGDFIFFRYESGPIPVGTTTFTFDIGVLSETITVHADCDGGDTCEFEDPDGEWEAEITCKGDCTVVIHEPDGAVADIEVTEDTPFTLVLKSTGKGTPPGRATVDKVDPETGLLVIETLPKCTGKTKTDCVTIIRVKGARTQYTIKYTEDPRFRFR